MRGSHIICQSAKDVKLLQHALMTMIRVFSSLSKSMPVLYGIILLCFEGVTVVQCLS